MFANKSFPWAIRPLVPEDVYTDRREYIDYFYKIALKAITRRSMSTVLLGQRRMGKTEIFKRVVNKLFFEQEEPANPDKSVVPVYFCFPDHIGDRWDFCIRYIENFIRWYAAFRLQDIRILSSDIISLEQLPVYIQSNMKITESFQGALNFLGFLQNKDVSIPEWDTMQIPRRVSDRDESSIVMFLDEFQNTRLPQYNFDVVGYMQESVESPTCPHFVTGSAVSILGQEILGRGALFGRFDNEAIYPLTEYWGAELARNAANYYRAEIAEDMLAVLASRCGGNPFYITALVLQSIEQEKPIVDEDTLEDILALDLATGFIWGELSDQVHRWIERINEYGISKWILYLAALEEGEKIDPEHIQQQLRHKQGSEVSLEKIRDILVKLSRGDLLEHLDLGGWFRKLKDPILADFLRAWGRIVVEGESQVRVQNELRQEYERLLKRIADHKGYVAEIYLAQILWSMQGKPLPAQYVHTEQDVWVPHIFSYVWNRVRLGAGPDREVDVYAGAGKEHWIAECKWQTRKKVGQSEVQAFLELAPLVLEHERGGVKILRMWFFSYSGFTPEAEQLMYDNGILWSDKQDLNALLEQAGLRCLPELESSDR